MICLKVICKKLMKAYMIMTLWKVNLLRKNLFQNGTLSFNPYPPSHVHTIPSPLVNGKGPSSSPTDLNIPLVALTNISRKSKQKIKNSEGSRPSWKRLLRTDLTEKIIGASILDRKRGVSVDEICLS